MNQAAAHTREYLTRLGMGGSVLIGRYARNYSKIIRKFLDMILNFAMMGRSY